VYPAGARKYPAHGYFSSFVNLSPATQHLMEKSNPIMLYFLLNQVRLEVQSMDAIKAILARHSVRDFSSKSVAKETVMKILEAATRSPSGGNSQPWEVFVASGATMEKIRQRYLERARSGASGPGRPGGPGGSSGPPPMPAFIQERMTVIRNERLKLLGLDPADPKSMNVFMEWGQRLFGAPVMVVVCMDKALSANLDIGMFVQTICIAAQGYGVDSFIASGFVSQPDILRQELEIPENLNIITGIGLGYPNPDNIINTYRSPRRPIQEVVRYKD
jgi:nitroreductase